MDAIQAIAAHVVETEFEHLPDPAVRATKTFLLDTLGVAAAGSRSPLAAPLIETQRRSLPGDQSRVWVHGSPLAAAGAAMCNAFQIHNSEFDCIHEAAVVHAMTVPLAATLAHAERSGGIDGRSLITALALGVDVACVLGISARTGLRFFRPATAGAFGATAAIGKLAGFDRETLVAAFGCTLGQLCGTMQAHVEGSAMLALQAGFNARNAVIAADLAAHGLDAPKAVLEGPFGYFALFEGRHDLGPALARLGEVWRVTELAHKPYPSGRATHGIIDGCLRLRSAEGVAAGDVARLRVRVPALVHQLVGRPVRGDMDASYGRLCAPYAAARALLDGGLTVADFDLPRLRDRAALALGRRIEVEVDPGLPAEALTPVTVQAELRDGRQLNLEVAAVLGSPAKPLSGAAHLEKFRQNWRMAEPALDATRADTLIAAVDGLETRPTVQELVELMLAETGRN